MNGLLYSRGLLSRDYHPTMFDVLSVWHEIYDKPPINLKVLKLGR